MRTWIPFVLMMMAVVLLAGPAQAQVNRAIGGEDFHEPRAEMRKQKPLEPPPPRQPHPYDIQPNSGNFAICVTSFESEPPDPTDSRKVSVAFQMAYDLVSELRADCKLPAHFFDRGEMRRQEEYLRLKAKHDERWKMYESMGLPPPERAWYKTFKIQDQYAVLVADPTFKDEAAARKALEQMRKLKPPSDKFMHREWVMGPPGTEMKLAAQNPFVTAFVVPNPAAPKSAVKPDAKAEEFSLREWNTGETYSAIHKIPGKWTLVVRSYRGATRWVSQNQERSTVERISGRQGNLSDANAKSAHQLADILRSPQLKFDSYVLHMPGMSIVTVGAFDSKDDARLLSVMNSVSKLQLTMTGGVGSGETLDQPTPWKVPLK